MPWQLCMNPGKLTLTLAVGDLDRSLDFYQKLGFWVVDGGHISSKFRDTDSVRWRIVECGETRLGLFQGVFPTNVLTFHPGNLELTQLNLKRAGIPIKRELEPDRNSGSIVLEDPDGNLILFNRR
ncbi:MAG: VOC family protein [Planctomycetaceae bacterium]|nr:VOC family protein [Planctomycetaceae bacterium]